MRPWRCHTSSSHPTQVARPDRWDADMSSATVDSHHSSTLTDIILRGGVGAQPITTPVAGQPPEEITLERALSDFLSWYYPSPLMIMIQSSPLPTTHVIMLFERFTIECALSRFSPGSPPARLILGVPLLGSPPGHHHVIITSSSTHDRASDEPLQRALGVRGST